MVLFAGVLVVGILIGSMGKSVFSSDNFFEQSKKFNQAFINIIKYYVDDVDSQKLTESAIKGMLEELDPHSAYLPPKAVESENQRFSGNFEGVGIQFQIIKDTLTVDAARCGGPNDSSSVKITDDGVIKRLRGPKGTKVVIKVKRSGFKELLSFTIIRDKIPQNSVASAKMLDEKTGYIFITSFIATTHSELVESIKLLRQMGMQQLVLDLRSNPGGYLDQAIKVADEFLPEGKKIVYTKGRVFPEEAAFATSGGLFEKGPLIILIDRGSASASEIVSGAVQDHDRGIIVGETSFGKGLVQRPMDLPDGSQIRLTISRYFTPSGRSIQRMYKKGRDGRESYYVGDNGKFLAEITGVTAEDSAKKLFTKMRGEPISSSAILQRDTIHERFKTTKGRLVLGSGGITPDYFIFPDTTSKALIDFVNKLGRDGFNNFALEFLNRNGKYREMNVSGVSKLEMESAISKFEKEFIITESVVKEFISFVEKQNIKYEEHVFNLNKDFFVNQIKAYIARNIWGYEAFMSVYLLNDMVLKKSKVLLSKAAEFAKNFQ
ncbi:hypothetical protein CHS0354_000497 [Potamilus streckersoni]|uniref:Tail specific protease domain-containing protein n=1 Tax=Potamilus streckersoni TaxID=2493646 RepID=A0AAE0T6N3_9BIVA|nr:hypothetical protein CHS0354_000497 [Potamilus streckersoni]